jgi:hypothetical protein
VAYILALLLRMMQIEPTCFTRSGNSSYLKNLGVRSVETFEGVKFKKQCAKSAAVFLPNGIEQALSFQASLSNARTLHNIKLMRESEDLFQRIPIRVYRLFATEMELQETLEKKGMPLKKCALSQVEFVKKLRFLEESEEPDFKLISVQSPQMALYPDYAGQEGYHISMENALDRMWQFLQRKTSVQKLAIVDKIYPFSKALDIHQHMDSGEYSGKLVLSLSELEDPSSTDKAIMYRNIGRLAEHAIPSSTLVSFLPMDQRVPHEKTTKH